MRPLRLSDLAAWCDARLQGADLRIERVGIDSRALPEGALFVALRGERFDGHDFAADALQGGAVAVLVERELTLDAPQLVVPDSQVALGRIAAGMASVRSTRLIGLTGSNGKTSVKTLTHAILSRVAPSYANPGNRNNEIGLPLALLDQPEDAVFGIYEMGAGQPGDIAYLAAIARPQVALVNNIGPAHLGRMGSLLAIARTKGAIYEALPQDGVAVINADDAFSLLFERMAGRRRILRFGIEASAEVRAERIALGPDGSRFDLVCPAGRVAVESPLPGRDNLMNALAAASLAVDAPLAAIVEGIAKAESVPGRLQRHKLPGGGMLIDDSYNANPQSVAAAIAALAARPGQRILVLGEMRELGPDSARLHAEVGQGARQAGIEQLYTLGGDTAHTARAFGAGAHHFEALAELVEALFPHLSPESCVLVKGSRGAAMERVVQALLARAGETSHAA
jgi:UDP-N-acetylmuramoyl-tripeptide--D-alanyl-D-alanine ligase